MEAPSQPSGGDQDKGPLYSAVAVTFCALACLSVLLRLFVRALSITTAGFNVTSQLAGFGRHEYYLSYYQLSRALKYTVLGEIFYGLSLTLGKISICLLLLRILGQSGGTKKRVFLYFTIGLLTITIAICLGQLLGQCQPVSKQWNPKIPGNCADPIIYTNISYFNGAVAAWVDFSLAVFPVTFVKDLQLSMRNKVALAGLLSCGVFAGICAIVRTSLESTLSVTSDITWALVDAAVWALVETNVTIIVACIPTLQPLYTAIVKTLPSTKGNHGPRKHWYQARSYAGGFKRNGTFDRAGNGHYLDPEAGMPIEMMAYVSPRRQKESGKLMSDAEMPGITAETVVRILSTHVVT